MNCRKSSTRVNINEKIVICQELLVLLVLVEVKWWLIARLVNRFVNIKFSETGTKCDRALSCSDVVLAKQE